MAKVLYIDKAKRNSPYMEALQAQGHCVDWIKKDENLINVLPSFQKHAIDYDVILMHMEQPHISDYQFIAGLRKIKPDHLSIIALCNNHELNQEDALALNYSCDYAYTSPISIETLGTIIAPHTTIEATPSHDPYVLIEEIMLKQLENDLGIEVLKSLLDSFLDDTQARVQRIVMAFEHNKLQIVSDEAHSLKSSSGSFGAKRVHDLARALEHCMNKKDETEIKKLVHELDEVTKKTLVELKARYA